MSTRVLRSRVTFALTVLLLAVCASLLRPIHLRAAMPVEHGVPGLLLLDPLPTFPDWTATGEGSSAEFGYSVATAGDLNGDGYADVLVGAYEYDTGRVYAYTGGPAGLSATPIFTASGEGYYDYFGRTIGTAGDVDGDGYDEIIVGAHRYDEEDNHLAERGRAYIYRGGPGGLSATPVLTLTGEGADDAFGYSVGTAGDVNGDGYDEIIVGAAHHSDWIGRVYVYGGGPGGLSATPVFTATGEAGSYQFGMSAGTAGDVNGDGYADVIIAAPGYQQGTSRAYVYGGSADGLSAVPVFTATGEVTRSYFYCVGTAGDVEGDGYDDVAIGAAQYGEDQGRVYVYRGSPGGLSAAAVFTATGEFGGDYFGYSVGTAGDVDGDGHDDLIVGAVYYTGRSSTGRAYLYRGGPAGLSAIPQLLINPEDLGHFGVSVGTAGDVNADGYADVIIGDPVYDRYTGRAYAYYGWDVAPQPEVWVDDDYCDGCTNDGHTWGTDALATIQDGITAVAVGGTVHVAAGLYTEHLGIAKDLTIQGAGQQDTVLDAGGTGRGVLIADAAVSISGLTIRNGLASSEGGGGIRSKGALTLSRCTVMSNSGGGIRAQGTAVLSECQVLSNTAGSNAGIYADELTLSDTTVSGNASDSDGGGIYVLHSATLIGCTVSHNTAGGNGGGLSVHGAVTITNSTLISNTAGYQGGGLFSRGRSIINGSSLISNTALHGGGMYNLGQAVLENDTVEHNLALGESSTGGGLLNQSGATLTVSGGTVAANHAEYQGGGIYNDEDGTLVVSGCTFTGNSARQQGSVVHNSGLARLSGCDVGHNGSGAPSRGTVYNAGTMTIAGSRVHDNNSYECGGIASYGQLDIADSVIDHNYAYYVSGICGGGINITRSTISYNGPTKYDYSVGTGAITITYSRLDYEVDVRASWVAYSWISATYLTAHTAFGNEFVSGSGVTGTAVYLNNHNWQYPGWPEAWVLTDTVAMETVTDGTLDARATSGIEVDVAGTTTLFLGRLAGTLGGAQPFVPIPGGYFDVLSHDPSGLSEVTIRYYYPEGPEESVLGLWWWDGAQWRECSDQGINTADLPGYGGYLWARIAAGTVPALGEWSGGPFVAAENWLVLQQGLEGYSGAADTYIYQYDPTTNYCQEPLIRVGYKQQNAGLLRFALPSLPDDVILTGATLQVMSRGWSGENMALGAYVISRTVEVCEATWDQAGAGNPWGYWGANDISSDRRPDPESALTTHGNMEWHDFDLSDAVRGWLEGTLPNNGVLLRALGPDELSFYFGSAENETLEYRPRLVIRWRPAPIPTPTPTSPTPGLNVSGHVRLDSASGPGVPGVTVSLGLASYPPSRFATTGADGYYEFAFVYIPGDEMITVRAEAAGYAFDPPWHYWRHWYGVENAVRDFVAYAVTPTPTATVTETPTPAPTATPTLTPTPVTRRAYLPLVVRRFVPRR